MRLFVIVLAALAAILLAASTLWRRAADRRSLPCPAWLGWLVELDNPILRSNNARAILARLDLQPGMRVLDFGCGPGRLAIPLAKAVGPLGRVCALDAQEAMLRRVRKKAEQAGLDNIDLVRAAAGDGAPGQGLYDRAVLAAVLGEVPDRPALLGELKDCLKPNGLVCIAETAADPHFQPRARVRGLAEQVGFVEQECFGNRLCFSLILKKPRMPR